MGCSAGSLGALLNAPFVFKRFPDATHRVWAESEVGLWGPTQWYDLLSESQLYFCCCFLHSKYSMRKSPSFRANNIYLIDFHFLHSPNTDQLLRAGAWNNWNIQLAPWIPALAPQYTKPYTTDVTAYIVSETALFYPTSTWGLYTSNSDSVRLGLGLSS